MRGCDDSVTGGRGCVASVTGVRGCEASVSGGRGCVASIIRGGSDGSVTVRENRSTGGDGGATCTVVGSALSRSRSDAGAPS